MIDGDGSPRCYGPDNSGLDLTANGGPPHNPYGYELNPRTGKPFIQGEDAPEYDAGTRGFYVSSTTYQRKEFAPNDPHRYLNSEKEIFAVVPGAFRRHVPGIVMGCKFTAEYEGKVATGIVGDIGPDFGEGSIALAEALGIPSSPRDGGVSGGVTWRFYPGVAVDGYELQRA